MDRIPNYENTDTRVQCQRAARSRELEESAYFTLLDFSYFTLLLLLYLTELRSSASKKEVMSGDWGTHHL
jgi:hypothetical protein